MIRLIKAMRHEMLRYPGAYRALKSVWTPPTRVRRHLYCGGEIAVEVEGLPLKLEGHGEYIENEMFWKGFGNSWEGNSLRIWTRLAKQSQAIVDVGANTGVYSLAAKTVNPAAVVVALEPSPRTLAKLQRNIELNGFDIVALGIAASDSCGDTPFYDWPEANQYTASLEACVGGTNVTTVRAERLDDLLPRCGLTGLDLIKIDVELHEPSVLRGMRKTLERCRPTMLVEVLTGEVECGIRNALKGLDYWVAPVPVHDSPDPVSDKSNILYATREVFETVLTDLEPRRL